MPWLFIALVKIMEPIEGAKAAQIGLLDTDSSQRNSQILGKGFKVTLFQGIGDAVEKRQKTKKTLLTRFCG